MFGEEIIEDETFVQLARQSDAVIRGDLRTLEIDLQRGVEEESKRLLVYRPPREGLERVHSPMNRGVQRL